MDMAAIDPETQSLKYPFRILRHRILGRLYELALTHLEIDVQPEIQMMSEPPRADLLLIRRKGKAWTKEQRAALPDGIRDRNPRYHLLECKFTESVNEYVIQRSLGYDVFYLGTQRIKPSNLQTYVISAKTPTKNLLERLGYRCLSTPGIYETTHPILDRIVIIVLNELSNEPHNEFLRLFASRQQIRQQTLAVVLRQESSKWSEQVWSLLFGLQRLYQMEGEEMQRELTVDDVMQIGNTIRKQAIATAQPKDLSDEVRKQVIENASPKERLAGLAPEERLAGLAPEEILAGLQPDEIAALFEQIEAMLSQQSHKATRQAKHRRKRK